MAGHFHDDEKLLVKEGSLLEKYALRAVGTTNVVDFIVYELVGLLLIWIPGSLGLGLRYFLMRPLFKNTGGKNLYSHHLTIRGGKKISLGRNVHLDSFVTLDVKDPKAQGIEIGSNTFVERFSVISSGIGERAFVRIGDDCSIGPSVNIYGHGGVDIGRNVMIASHACIIASSHGFEDAEKPMFDQGHVSKGIVIEDDVWLGSGCKVLDGVRIGTGSIIGAGAVVTEDVEPYSMCVGVPARTIRKRK